MKLKQQPSDCSIDQNCSERHCRCRQTSLKTVHSKQFNRQLKHMFNGFGYWVNGIIERRTGKGKNVDIYFRYVPHLPRNLLKKKTKSKIWFSNVHSNANRFNEINDKCKYVWVQKAHILIVNIFFCWSWYVHFIIA